MATAASRPEGRSANAVGYRIACNGGFGAIATSCEYGLRKCCEWEFTEKQTENAQEAAEIMSLN